MLKQTAQHKNNWSLNTCIFIVTSMDCIYSTTGVKYK